MTEQADKEAGTGTGKERANGRQLQPHALSPVFKYHRLKKIACGHLPVTQHVNLL